MMCQSRVLTFFLVPFDLTLLPSTAHNVHTKFFQLFLTLSLLLRSIIAHPAPSLALCHGHQFGIQYSYDYATSMVLNNNDHMGKEPVGFNYEGHFQVETVWENEADYILKISFGESNGGHFLTRKKEKKWGIFSYTSANEVTMDKEFPLYVHIRDEKDTQEVKKYFVHKDDLVIASNLKKSIALLLRTKNHKEEPQVTVVTNGVEQMRTFGLAGKDENVQRKKESVFAPQVVDQWVVKSKLSRDHAVVTECSGWQNVSFISRAYEDAYSKLHLQFHLKLTKEASAKNKQSYSDAKSVEDFGQKLGHDFTEDFKYLQQISYVCHKCAELSGMVSEYHNYLIPAQMATVPAAIAYLKLVERIRYGGQGASFEDIVDVLKKNKGDEGVLSSLLDVLAGAMTEDSVSAALDFLNLPSQQNLDISERFLGTLGTAYLASAQTGANPPQSSHDFIITKLRTLLGKGQWASVKLRQSALLCVGTLLRARHIVKGKIDETSKQITDDIVSEMNACKDSECKSVLIYTLRNAANLELSMDVLEKHALNFKDKQVALAALKSIIDSLETLEFVDVKLLQRLKSFIPAIAFDDRHETTARIIATEIIMKYLDETIQNTLVNSIQHFENHEMTTLMWAKAIEKAKSRFSNALNNWHLHSKRFNGTSTSFKKRFGGSKTVNATYALTMEQLTKGNLLKESSFDVELNDLNGNSQHLLSVGLFAKGMESFVGGSSEEDATAGMSLKILGTQVRPYTFFTGTSELMGHVWSGTASDLTSAFQGNFLMVDNTQSHQLINGFVAEHRMRGVLSLDLSGEIQISLWNKNSHSVVRTSGSLLVQGSQNIFTADNLVSVSQQFSFGGSMMVDFVTDIDFYSSPFKMCMQIIQPEFNLRHNTRKYEKMETKVDRRIHRRSYSIAAKSYSLHHSNNQMCSIMHN